MGIMAIEFYTNEHARKTTRLLQFLSKTQLHLVRTVWRKQIQVVMIILLSWNLIKINLWSNVRPYVMLIRSAQRLDHLIMDIVYLTRKVALHMDNPLEEQTFTKKHARNLNQLLQFLSKTQLLQFLSKTKLHLVRGVWRKQMDIAEVVLLIWKVITINLWRNVRPYVMLIRSAQRFHYMMMDLVDFTRKVALVIIHDQDQKLTNEHARNQTQFRLLQFLSKTQLLQFLSKTQLLQFLSKSKLHLVRGERKKMHIAIVILFIWNVILINLWRNVRPNVMLIRSAQRLYYIVMDIVNFTRKLALNINHGQE